MSASLDPTGIRAVLLDVDGTLVPSEEPAFDASATVTQDFAAAYGLQGDFTAEGLRRGGTGKNFRSTATDLLRAAGIEPDAALESWVEREKDEVTKHLASVLVPDPDVSAGLEALDGRYALAAVSSSASVRVATCLEAAGVDGLIAPEARFSAEDSLPVPTSKPDPAVYRAALEALGVAPHEAVAVEDAVAGVQSAVGAGITTVGVLHFVGPDEQDARREALLGAGAAVVVDTWPEVVEALLPDGHT